MEIIKTSPIITLKPITKIEKETAIYFLRDLTVKEIQAINNVSFDCIQSRARQIRSKMHSSTIYGALARMVALGMITIEELTYCLPEGWKAIQVNKLRSSL